MSVVGIERSAQREEDWYVLQDNLDKSMPLQDVLHRPSLRKLQVSARQRVSVERSEPCITRLFHPVFPAPIGK